MRDKGFQVGLLFNHLPELVYFATNFFASETDLLLKVTQRAKNDSNITRDHQFFRKAANKELSAEELSNYLAPGKNALADLFDNLQKDYEVDVKHIGGWFILLSQIKGFKVNLKSRGEEKLINYLNFVEELCLLEYNFIKENQGKNNVDFSNQFLTSWLNCEPLSVVDPTKSNQAQYLISIVMHWAALFEKLLEIEYEDSEQGYHSIIVKSLPSISTKKEQHYFHSSTEVLITEVKDMFAKKIRPNKKYKWTEFYKDIAIAQLTDPNMSTTPLKPNDNRLISPDTSAIKKQISRWREGSRLSIEHLKKYFIILNHEYDPKDADFSLFSIELINLFTFIQKELLKDGTSPEVIVNCFARYEEYKDLVNKRFENYQVNKVLTP